MQTAQLQACMLHWLCVVHARHLLLYAAAHCKSEVNSRKFERCEHDDTSVTVARIAKPIAPNCSAIQYASNDTFRFFVRCLQLLQEPVPCTLPKEFSSRDQIVTPSHFSAENRKCRKKRRRGSRPSLYSQKPSIVTRLSLSLKIGN